jgi:hypothetical protein
MGGLVETVDARDLAKNVRGQEIETEKIEIETETETEKNRGTVERSNRASSSQVHHQRRMKIMRYKISG